MKGLAALSPMEAVAAMRPSCSRAILRVGLLFFFFIPRAVPVVAFARTTVPGEIYRRLPAWRSVQLPTKAASRRRRRLDVPRQRRQVRGRPRFVHLRFKISRFLQQSPGNLGVPGCFGEL